MKSYLIIKSLWPSVVRPVRNPRPNAAPPSETDISDTETDKTPQGASGDNDSPSEAHEIANSNEGDTNNTASKIDVSKRDKSKATSTTKPGTQKKADSSKSKKAAINANFKRMDFHRKNKNFKGRGRFKRR